MPLLSPHKFRFKLRGLHKKLECILAIIALQNRVTVHIRSLATCLEHEKEEKAWERVAPRGTAVLRANIQSITKPVTHRLAISCMEDRRSPLILARDGVAAEVVNHRVEEKTAVDGFLPPSNVSPSIKQPVYPKIIQTLKERRANSSELEEH
ncbi:hypothetical protein PoB_005723500 [Plakobranchus ocellatus]|uniref:Uncharacterized protein n=1 Tax=Plakobranchus ocellatus TaxID=259542 RepID=A0AAV4CD89_9GAST|nr:hypothetical protein PoB_005723500 [Plakobranchus ocellatus]